MKDDMIKYELRENGENDMLTELEFNILYFLQTLHNPWLDVLMKEVSSLANSGFFWIVTGVLLLFFKRTRKVGICVLLSLGIGFLAGNLVLKNLVGRSRPCWIDRSVPLLIPNPRDFSFPSGHTLASFEAAVSIRLFNRSWGRGALVLATLIAFSRMYLFVHFPTDVLGGMILGTAIAIMVHCIIKRVYEKKCLPF